MLDTVRRRISELIDWEDDAHEVESTWPSVSFKSQATANMGSKVRYVPTQMDRLADTSTRALGEGPLWLMIQDAGVLFKMLHYIPNIVLPIKASRPDDELAVSLAAAGEMIIQAFLSVFEIILLIATPFGILVSPGILFIPVSALAWILIYLVCWPLHGPDICYSIMDETTTALAEKHPDERWVFVNGCATNHTGLQKNIDRLSKTFGRKVVGVHNKSFGLVADILECLIQRCFAYKTQDVRIAYLSLKPLLMEGNVKKVVLVGHSQGGLIISLVLDQLFAEMPPENMAKLEIYTFGSAASHLSNPAVTLFPSNKQSSPSPKVHFDSPISRGKQQNVIGHIEHYANEYDVISRWGVLHSVCDIQSNRYAGSVFVRMHQSGHMFNQHYLDAMFPLPQSDNASSLVSFLDRAVSNNLELAWKQTVVPTAEITGILRRTTTGLEFGTGDMMLPKYGGQSSGPGTMTPPIASNLVMIFSRTASGVVVGEEANGKPVKELSRLWRYLGGESPDE